MNIIEFFIGLDTPEQFVKTKINSDEDVNNIYIMGLAMPQGIKKSIVLAFCYALGYGVTKDLNKFKQILVESLCYMDIRTYVWLRLALTTGLPLNGVLVKLDEDPDLLNEINPILTRLTEEYHNARRVEPKPAPRLLGEVLDEIIENINSENVDIKLIDTLIQESYISFNYYFNYGDCLRFEDKDKEFISKMFSLGLYEQTYRILELYRQHICHANEDGYVLEWQAMCLAEIGETEEAIELFRLAVSNGCSPLAFEYLDKLDV